MHTLWSTAYLEQDVDDYSCYLIEKDWLRITNENKSSRLFARIITQTNTWICSLGNPIRQEDIISSNPVYIPNWILEQLFIHGNGDEVEIEWIPSESLDKSHHITLRPFDSAFNCGDIKEQLQNELTHLGVLQKGTCILLRMEEFDNYEVWFYVSELEPSDVVLCEGDEVSIVFEESFDAPTESISNASAPTPSAPTPSAPIASTELIADVNLEELILPSPIIPIGPNLKERSLGGIKREGRYNPWRSKDTEPRS